LNVVYTFSLESFCCYNHSRTPLLFLFTVHNITAPSAMQV
jgi:hypothetical protein